MQAGEIWGPKGSDDMRALIRVSAVADGNVIAFPRFGGFEMRIPEAEFAAGFEHYPQERLEALEGRFEQALVGLDDFEEGEYIPCWTNGRTWNGWEVPYFERRHLDAAIEDGRITAGGSVLIWFDDKAGTYIEVMHQDGEMLPARLDREAIAAMATRPGGTDEFELPDGSVASVSVAPSRTIDTPEGPVTVYAVGDCWTWSRSEPSQTPAP